MQESATTEQQKEDPTRSPAEPEDNLLISKNDTRH
jgi:hypothetical protein